MTDQPAYGDPNRVIVIVKAFLASLKEEETVTLPLTVLRNLVEGANGLWVACPYSAIALEAIREAMKYLPEAQR